MKKRNLQQIVATCIPYLLFVLLGSKLGQACRLAPGDDFATKAMHIMEGLTLAFESLVPSFHPVDLLVGIAAAVFAMAAAALVLVMRRRASA